ncbi:hypothetical protein DL767_009392 [Monosporascus sp. MG133]|nr:hypothetical protein DL767_009392 [Monosporascus sp. MG133]
MLQDFIALQTTMRTDDENMACLRALYVVNPQDDMARIEGNKDKLLYDAYEWILRTAKYAAFRTWDDSDLPSCRLLWIKRHAGTGKTMLLIGIIRELSKQLAAFAPSLSYFFCQGTVYLKVKWMLSSRPEVDVLVKPKDLDIDNSTISQNLVELDTQSLADPIKAYIKHKLTALKGLGL